MKVNPKSIMQRTGFLLLLCLLSIVTICQTKETPFKKFYLEAATGVTNKNGISVELGIQAILKNNWTTTITYQKIEMDPKNLPSNYKEGVTLIIFIPVYDDFPFSKLNIFGFTAGKFYGTGRKTWFTAEAGLSIVNGEKIVFTPQPVVHEIFYTSSNYSFRKENKTTIGGMLKADFNWAFTSFMGAGSGVFANFNSIQTPLGFQLKLILGKMNRRGKIENKK
jgi:hypothetical protein